MKVLLRHEYLGAKRLHGKQGHKILKKMAKLQKKLGKYHLEESGEESCSSAASAVEARSRSRRRHHRGGRHQRRGRRSCSSSDSSSDSDSPTDSGSSSSSDSGSSRSPSPGHLRLHRHHHRHRGPAHRHLSRSKSFAGRGCGSPPPGFHHRHHHHPHHRDHHHHHHGHWKRHGMHKHRDGICGLVYRALARSEPNLPEPEAMHGDENRAEEVVRAEPEVSGASVQEAGQGGSEEISLELGPDLCEGTSQQLIQIIDKGLMADAKKTLLQKYPVSKNCQQLRAPKLNQEFLSVASQTAVKRDVVLSYEQNQIGTGLTALGQAMGELNAKAEAEANIEMIPILDAMNDAAAIIADAHHNITQMRQAFLAAELNKRVRPVVDTCKADELLFGKDFGDKVKDVRAFGKGKKGCEKKEKRKHAEQGAEKRKSKRLHHHGIMH